MNGQSGVHQTKFTTWAVFLAFGLAMVALVFVVNGRFNAGAQRRHDTCVQISAIKQILYAEHVPKLHKAAENVVKYPKGLTLQTSEGSVEVTHQDLLDTRRDEQRIVAATAPKECP